MHVLWGVLNVGIKHPAKRAMVALKLRPLCGWSVVNILNKPAIRFDSV